MKLSTREDVQAPRETVYCAMCDFVRIEDMLRGRGIKIQAERGAEPAIGDKWHAAFEWRGRSFDTAATLVRLDDGKGYTVESLTGGVTCTAEFDLLEVSSTRTRIFAALDFRPTTLSSRLLLQSLKLAKPRLTQRFSARVARFAATISENDAG